MPPIQAASLGTQSEWDTRTASTVVPSSPPLVKGHLYYFFHDSDGAFIGRVSHLSTDHQLVLEVVRTPLHSPLRRGDEIVSLRAFLTWEPYDAKDEHQAVRP